MPKPPAKPKTPVRPKYTDKDFVKSKAALARITGLSEQLLARLFKKDGCPAETLKGFCVPEFIAFAKKTVSRNTDTIDGFDSEGRPAAGGGTSDLASLRGRHLLAQISKIEQQLEIERGRYVSRQTLQAKLAQFLTELDMNFRRQFEQELPQALEGLAPMEIRAKLRESYQRVKEAFAEQIETL